jgi:hypothetical protein
VQNRPQASRRPTAAFTSASSEDGVIYFQAEYNGYAHQSESRQFVAAWARTLIIGSGILTEAEIDALVATAGERLQPDPGSSANPRGLRAGFAS